VTVSRRAIGVVGITVAWAVALAPAVTPSDGALLAPGADSRGTSALRSTAARGVTSPPRPHGLKLFINGRRYATTPLSGSDNYVDIAPGSLKVVARWLTDARGTGYHVVISTTEPVVRTYASCSTGTSCRVTKPVRIRPNQEMSWEVRIVKTRGNRLVAGFKVCLDGRS
jgi:hypothetical protein